MSSRIRIARVVWDAAQRAQMWLYNLHRNAHHRLQGADDALHGILCCHIGPAIQAIGNRIAGCGCVRGDSFQCGAALDNWIVDGEREGYGCFCKCHEEP